MCQGYGQQMQEGKHICTRTISNLYCAASILRRQTVQHERIITETQKKESRRPDFSPQAEKRPVGGGQFPFKVERTIMKLSYLLQEWRTHYPPFQQGAHDFSESITFVLMLHNLHWCVMLTLPHVGLFHPMLQLSSTCSLLVFHCGTSTSTLLAITGHWLVRRNGHSTWEKMHFTA